jgi:hypothetical protein
MFGRGIALAATQPGGLHGGFDLVIPARLICSAAGIRNIGRTAQGFAKSRTDDAK